MTPILFLLLFQPPGTNPATQSSAQSPQVAPPTLGGDIQPSLALPQSAVFLLAGYGQKIDGTAGYAETISQSAGLMSASYFRYIPIHGKLLNLSFPAVTTGAALHLRDFSAGAWGARIFALAQAGAVTTGTATLLTQSYGGFVTIGQKSWTHLDFLVGVDIVKTATGTSYPNWDFGLVVKP